MGTFSLGRRRVVYGAAVLAAGTVGGLSLWPSSKISAGYPLARRALGGLDPLWSVPPDVLLTATSEDAARLAQLMQALTRATQRLEALEPRLGSARVGELSAEDRAVLRSLWWQFFEPILAIDELKSRYGAWYGLDYLKYPQLHARGFALSFAALCAQVEAGLRSSRPMVTSSSAGRSATLTPGPAWLGAMIAVASTASSKRSVKA